MALSNEEEESNLYSREMLRFILHIHSAQADRNSPRRDYNHPMTILAELHGGLNNKSNDREKWRPGLFINNGATTYGAFPMISYQSLRFPRSCIPSLIIMVRRLLPFMLALGFEV